MTLTSELTEKESSWDRTLLNLSSKFTEPACLFYSLIRYRLFAPFKPGQFGFYKNPVQEAAYRVFVFTLATFSTMTVVIPVTVLSLAAIGKVLRAVGFSLQKNGYTHVGGNAAEKVLEHGKAKLMTWNICGILMSPDHGGIRHPYSRLDAIVQKIVQEDADVVVLQEIYDTEVGERLVEKLKDRYAHFFMHLGKNTWGSVGGVMILSKCAYTSFTNESFLNNSWTLNRTFATLEIKKSPNDTSPCARIIGTHLIHTSNEDRFEQLAQIKESLKKKEKSFLPTVLLGDLNLEKEDPEQGKRLDPDFIHAYQGNIPTQTNRMNIQWDPKLATKLDETIDYISLFKAHEGLRVIESEYPFERTHLSEAFDPKNPDSNTALSDHQIIGTTLKFENTKPSGNQMDGAEAFDEKEPTPSLNEELLTPA